MCFSSCGRKVNTNFVHVPFLVNEVNVDGTLKLLIRAKESQVRRVVFASSSSVYGISQKFPQKESYPSKPISPYAVSKLAAENYCFVFSRIYGLETVSLRYFNVFGPRQSLESKYFAIIPKFLNSALRKERLEIHGDGKQSRDFTYIDNVVEANILAATACGISGEVFNIALNKTYSVLDIAKKIEKIIGYKLDCNFTPARSGDVKKTRADISKAKKMMGYSPRVGFDEGLKKTVEWFRSNQGK